MRNAIFALFIIAVVFSTPLAEASYHCGPYTYTVANGQATIIGFDRSYSGALSITNTLGRYPVTSIGARAFAECARLTRVTIPDSVASIGASAFYFCTS